ncbi:hypothetical protein [Feifania hominis]|uniref:Cell division protein FtsL n=1 Tax=Feifania hominis TaxID=2763660 RepID=A0A926DBS6_9FIRM|nr:hypothetical protein [Feifania hominis]MBC8535183.1 hypothetical protein [Feifania hominis]
MQNVNRQSVAYDFSMFDERSREIERRREQNNIVDLISKRKKKRKARAVFLNILCCVLLVGLLSTQIYSYTTLNELTSDISRQKKTLDELQAQEKLLNIDLEKQIDLTSVEEIATNTLFMEKADKNQISYISTASVDNGEIIGGDSRNFFEKLRDDVLQKISSIAAYLNG